MSNFVNKILQDASMMNNEKDQAFILGDFNTMRYRVSDAFGLRLLELSP